MIATTSEMLSTGVDLPTSRSIVLFRPVGSMAMFKQMIGRGTHLYPDEDKLSFDIIDYSGATALLGDPEFDGPPEHVDEEEIDDEGNVVDEPPSSKNPNPVSNRPTATVPSTQMTSTAKPRAKFYVDDGEVWVTAKAIYHLDPETQRLRLVGPRLRDRDRPAARCTPTPRPSAAPGPTASAVKRSGLRSRRTASTPKELLKRTGMPTTDPIDVLVHLASTSRSRLARTKPGT